MEQPQHPVLILGAGINGAAVARELALNGVPVCVVDTGDISGGATAGSSRLIHGGLRYLEYADVKLVRESLRERERLLRLAPQFVKPLHLFIPVERFISGLLQSAGRFFRLGFAEKLKPVPRGLGVVWFGLLMYDLFSRGSSLPRRDVHRAGGKGVPAVDGNRFHWLCSYFDGQIVYPERFVLAMLEDARALAADQGIAFHVFTHHEAGVLAENGKVEIRSAGGDGGGDEPALTIEPAAIVNATGAWIDETLKRLELKSPRLIGGTKGSHIITRHPALREAMGDDGIYAEAPDGRPVFLLPFGDDATLIGTTDLPIDGPTGEALTDGGEIEYLIAAAHRIFPDTGLCADDIDLHTCGVRPLAFVPSDGREPASVTRQHRIEECRCGKTPLWSLIGGKLTTSRALAEQTAAIVLDRLQADARTLPQRKNTRDRRYPGADSHPADPTAVASVQLEIANRLALENETVRAVWRLYGSRAEPVLAEAVKTGGSAEQLVPDTPFPRGLVRWIIRNEWVTRLSDLVNRRLMLVYSPGSINDTGLHTLAELMVEEKILNPGAVDSEIASCKHNLEKHFGIRIK